MSVKAVKNYYDQICDQYREMLENIKDLEKECQDGLVEPERIERLKEQIAPLKQNYERWTFMMYLLHQPQKKEKHSGYRKRNEKLLSSLEKKNSINATIHENTDVLNSLKGGVPLGRTT